MKYKFLQTTEYGIDLKFMNKNDGDRNVIIITVSIWKCPN